MKSVAEKKQIESSNKELLQKLGTANNWMKQLQADLDVAKQTNDSVNSKLKAMVTSFNVEFHNF